jgi:DNA-binding HxlR family transcriptional regulator
LSVDTRRRAALYHAASALQSKWALVVVAELLVKPQRFSELRDNLDHFNPKTLTQTLRRLERERLVHRSDNPAAYALTDRGRALTPVVDAVVAWSARELGDGELAA